MPNLIRLIYWNKGNIKEYKWTYLRFQSKFSGRNEPVMLSDVMNFVL